MFWGENLTHNSPGHLFQHKAYVDSGRLVEIEETIVSENAGLDVGCGGTRHRGFVGLDIRRNVGVDILADAHFLPFVDEAFTVVYSSHVLEHVKHPYIALVELRRVSRKAVVIRVPMSNPYSDPKEHLYSWTPATLYNFLTCEFQDVRMSYHLYSEVGLNPVKRKVKIFQQILVGFLLRRKIGELLAVCQKPQIL
jgi:SAM-dependent methyltransferase